MFKAGRLERQAGRPRYPNAIIPPPMTISQSAIRNPQSAIAHLRPPFFECRMRLSRKFVSIPSNG